MLVESARLFSKTFIAQGDHSHLLIEAIVVEVCWMIQVAHDRKKLNLACSQNQKSGHGAKFPRLAARGFRENHFSEII